MQPNIFTFVHLKHPHPAATEEAGDWRPATLLVFSLVVRRMGALNRDWVTDADRKWGMCSRSDW